MDPAMRHKSLHTGVPHCDLDHLRAYEANPGEKHDEEREDHANDEAQTESRTTPTPAYRLHVFVTACLRPRGRKPERHQDRDLQCPRVSLVS